MTGKIKMSFYSLFAPASPIFPPGSRSTSNVLHTLSGEPSVPVAPFLSLLKSGLLELYKKGKTSLEENGWKSQEIQSLLQAESEQVSGEGERDRRHPAGHAGVENGLRRGNRQEKMLSSVFYL